MIYKVQVNVTTSYTAEIYVEGESEQAVKDYLDSNYEWQDDTALNNDVEDFWVEYTPKDVSVSTSLPKHYTPWKSSPNQYMVVNNGRVVKIIEAHTLEEAKKQLSIKGILNEVSLHLIDLEI
jgi:hypothetical protein